MIIRDADVATLTRVVVARELHKLIKWGREETIVVEGENLECKNNSSLCVRAVFVFWIGICHRERSDA